MNNGQLRKRPMVVSQYPRANSYHLTQHASHSLTPPNTSLTSLASSCDHRRLLLFIFLRLSSTVAGVGGFTGCKPLYFATLLLLFFPFSLPLIFSTCEDRRWHVPGRPQAEEPMVSSGIGACAPYGVVEVCSGSTILDRSGERRCTRCLLGGDNSIVVAFFPNPQ